MMQDGQWFFHNQIKAFVHHIQYDWDEGYGQIWARGPVDMSGSIRFFTFIDEGARLILAYLDGEPDICYRKREDGTWEAGDLRKLCKIRGLGHSGKCKRRQIADILKKGNPLVRGRS